MPATPQRAPSQALPHRVSVALGLLLSGCASVSSTRVPTDITRVAVVGIGAPDQFVVGDQTFRVPDFVGIRGPDQVSRQMMDGGLARAARRWSVVRLSDRDVRNDFEIMLARLDDGSDRSTRSAGGLPRVPVNRVLNASEPHAAETVSTLAWVANRLDVDSVIVLELRCEPLPAAAQQSGGTNACFFGAAMVKRRGEVIDLTPLHKRITSLSFNFEGAVLVQSPAALARTIDDHFETQVSQWLYELGFMSQSRR